MVVSDVNFPHVPLNDSPPSHFKDPYSQNLHVGFEDHNIVQCFETRTPAVIVAAVPANAKPSGINVSKRQDIYVFLG